MTSPVHRCACGHDSLCIRGSRQVATRIVLRLDRNIEVSAGLVQQLQSAVWVSHPARHRPVHCEKLLPFGDVFPVVPSAPPPYGPLFDAKYLAGLQRNGFCFWVSQAMGVDTVQQTLGLASGDLAVAPQGKLPQNSGGCLQSKGLCSKAAAAAAATATALAESVSGGAHMRL